MKNRAELRALLQENHTSAWGWALCCCDGDREMAEDILHSAYLRILQGKAVFDGRSGFRTWLFAVIRRMAVSSRMQIRRRLERLTAKFRDLSFSGEEVEARLFQLEIRAHVSTMLGRLSRRQREVLQLVFYHELTIEDSARVMGVSVGSARTHYHRGKNRLRLLIDEAGLRNER